LQGGKDSASRSFRHDGTTGSLVEHSGGSIGVHSNDQGFTKVAGRFEAGDVAVVEKIEHTIGEDESMSIGTSPLQERIEGDDLQP
jgi:hypothetical protein